MHRLACLAVLPLAALAVPSARPAAESSSAVPTTSRVASAGVAPSAVDFEHAFEKVAEFVRPGVVTITSARRVRQREQIGPRELLGMLEGAQIDGRLPNQDREEDMPLKEYGLGSGLVLSPDGYILTNHHVVEGGGRLKVHLGDRRTFDARVVGVDPQTDLAVVKVEANNLAPAKFGDSRSVKVGQWVAAFGSPFGLDQTMSCGIVSAKSRANLHLVDDEDYLQTDAAINPGNSGGPLVNLAGEVVGINAAIVSRTGGYQGIGLAIPAHMAKEISTKLMKDGKVVRGWLGVAIQELTTDLARAFAAKTEEGVLVAEIVPDSPAARAGLLAGDIVVSIDGKRIEGPTMFRHAIADMRPGTKCLLIAWREGRELELWAEISSTPRTGVGAVVDAAAKTYFGLELADATTLKPGSWRLQEGRQGVVVTKVLPDSCAETCGLRAGDILVQIERTKVRDAAQARELLKGRTGEGAALLVERAGAQRWLHLDAVEGN